MTEIATKLCSDCRTPLERYFHGYECGGHVASEMEKVAAYVIDAQSPRTYANWDEIANVCIRAEDLPAAATEAWFSKEGCCASWQEPDWVEDYCPKCRDEMEPAVTDDTPTTAHEESVDGR